ncbi:Class II histone deacetylase complex subunits 2 and 3 domain containing protein [Elaphomyces granulatus]
MGGQVPSSGISSVPEALEKYNHVPGSTPREKIRNAYAQLRANTKSLQNISASATPSSAGDIEPVAALVSEPTSPLSVRIEKNTPSPAIPAEQNQPPSGSSVSSLQTETSDLHTIQPNALAASHSETFPPGSVRLGPSEFAITLPMDSRVKDEYERALTDEARGIQNFLLTFTSTDPIQVNSETSQLIVRANRLIQKLDNIAVHPDLNIAEHIKNTEPDPKKAATWAEYSSSKFQFLGHLMDISANHGLHIIIMTRKERTVEIVEKYLLGKGFSYTRPRVEMGGNTEISLKKGKMSFGIHITQSDTVVEVYRHPSLIIALDSSFNVKSPSVENLRITYARHGNLVPVIWLLSSNTSEHIKLCLPDVSAIQKLRLLIYHAMLLRNTVGDLQDDALGVHEDAEELLQYLLSEDFNARWSLPAIEPLKLLSPEEITSIPGDELAGKNPQSTTPLAQKRWLDDEGEGPSSKRQRMTPSDPSKPTESTKDPAKALDPELNTEDNLVQMKDDHTHELSQLQISLSNAQSRLTEREKVMESLQHRYESRTKEIHRIRQECNRLSETVSKSEQKLGKQQDDIAKLKDERATLKQELDVSRSALRDSGGLTADLEIAREEIRRLNKENASLEKKAESERKQAEYTREQYQNASTQAAQSAIEMRQLQEENEELKRKAAADASKLKELKMKNDENRHLSRILELELALQSRDELLRRKEEELRDLRKNRPSKRNTSSSQPRSPRWGPGNSRPASPGLNNSGIGTRSSALRFSSEIPL